MLDRRCYSLTLGNQFASTRNLTSKLAVISSRKCSKTTNKKTDNINNLGLIH